MGGSGKVQGFTPPQNEIKWKKSFFLGLRDYQAIDIQEKIVYHSYLNRGGRKMEAYCMKCRTKRDMKDAKSITMKNGKPATQGVCPTCGTKMFRIGKG